MGKSESQKTPNKLLLGSQQTQKVCNLVTLFGELFWRDHLMNSQQTPSGIPADSKWIPSGLPANLQPTPSGLPVDSQQTLVGLPMDTHWTSNRSPAKRILNRSQFGELIWRAFLESPFWELLWKLIVFHGEMGDSQQTPNKVLIGPQQTHPGYFLETSFGDLTWRAHLESSFGQTI